VIANNPICVLGFSIRAQFARDTPLHGLKWHRQDSGGRGREHIQVRGRETNNIFMVGGSQLVTLFAGALNRPELRFSEVLVPWIMIVGALGFLMAWLVVAIMEHTGLSRYVWHLPLFFVGLVVLFSSLIGMAVFP
jgi:predicted naringenin-chalcone synthase